MPFRLILRRFDLVSDVWSENAALFERLMEMIKIHQYYTLALTIWCWKHVSLPTPYALLTKFRSTVYRMQCSFSLSWKECVIITATLYPLTQPVVLLKTSGVKIWMCIKMELLLSSFQKPNSGSNAFLSALLGNFKMVLLTVNETYLEIPIWARKRVFADALRAL